MADNESGFEYRGIFYPWHVTTKGVDLLLIDRISGMNPTSFFELIEDSYDMSRAPVTLTLIATSMRNRHPERSLERILRTVMDIDIDADLEFINVDEEAEASPPAPSDGENDRPEPSSQMSNGSAEPASKTSHETPDSSGSPASPIGSGSNVTT